MADKEPEEEKKEEGEGAPGEEGAEPKKKSKKKLILIAGLVLLMIVGAGGGAYFAGFIGGGGEGENAEHAEGEEAAAHPAGPVVYFDLPEFLVNLNTSGRQTSFLKMTVVLELASAEDTPIVQANLPRVMDSFNTYLRELRATDLYGSAGLYRLREELLGRVNKAVAPAKVNDILFKQILVQ